MTRRIVRGSCTLALVSMVVELAMNELLVLIGHEKQVPEAGRQEIPSDC